MAKEIEPTFTLAKLYEEQLELVDAVNIYAELKKRGASPEIEKKIKEFTDIVFENITQNYAEVISDIFKLEELRSFRIIPGNSVQIKGIETPSKEVKLDVDPEIEEDDSKSEAAEFNIENEKEELEITNSELEELEKRLNDKSQIAMDDVLNDKESLQKEREELLKKLEAIEQKLQRLASEKAQEDGSDSASTLDIPDSEGPSKKVDFKRLNQVRSEQKEKPEEKNRNGSESSEEKTDPEL